MKNKTFFSYRTLATLTEDIHRKGLEITMTDKVQCLDESMHLHGKKVPNRLCLNPLEGCDAESNGSPGKLTYRRYKRFASGGAGMIWIEATAVTPEGRANPRQLWINNQSAESFKEVRRVITANAANHNSDEQQPFMVLQLTHSGRQSNPRGTPTPIITHHSEILDPNDHLEPSYPIISDKEIDALQGRYVQAAQLAYDCGFDAVDIKACHGYLVHELLFSYTRKNSRYGGSFENRTRFLREVVDKIKHEVPEIIVTTRLNIYDGIPYPWGWGMKTDGSLKADPSEPVRLISMLHDAGVELISIALGNPYYNPHLERPYDRPAAGGYVPKEHPLETIARTIRLTANIHDQTPGVHLVGTGLSWLRQFFPNVGAAMVQEGWISFLGVGRGALAHPSFANELLKNGTLAPEKLCITCSSCTQIMRDGGRTGCVIRDPEVYGPIYKAGRARALKQEQNLEGNT
ncbi:flavin oxidoreductase/NADH oxidase [Candidatus Bipolaricaulota bacterium]|nr:flavin oxidoreductase/NADH oxidase [Candidatus Bipolaricaulota bacterium]